MKLTLLRLFNVVCHKRGIHQFHPRCCAQGLAVEQKPTVYSHTPVMVQEVIEALSVQANGTYLDMTFGAGGHSKHILNTSSVKLYCLDRDPVAYNLATRLAEIDKDRIFPLLGKFSDLDHLMQEAGVPKNSLDGALIDAGCSSMQLDDSSRGFSFMKDGPLDMRMDGHRNPDAPTAADVVNTLTPLDLGKIIKVYGEERYGKKIAQGLFDFRQQLKNISTTLELANLVATIVGGEQRKDKLKRPAHIATRVFQALRIFVNNEMNELSQGIDLVHSYLKPGGRLVVLTFHSLEDRIVKRHILGVDMYDEMRSIMSQKYKNALVSLTEKEIEEVYSHKWVPMYKAVVTPTSDEVERNPRSRSAKLRGAIKTDTVK